MLDFSGFLRSRALDSDQKSREFPVIRAYQGIFNRRVVRIRLHHLPASPRFPGSLHKNRKYRAASLSLFELRAPENLTFGQSSRSMLDSLCREPRRCPSSIVPRSVRQSIAFSSNSVHLMTLRCSSGYCWTGLYLGSTADQQGELYGPNASF